MCVKDINHFAEVSSLCYTLRIQSKKEQIMETDFARISNVNVSKTHWVFCLFYIHLCTIYSFAVVFFCLCFFLFGSSEMCWLLSLVTSIKLFSWNLRLGSVELQKLSSRGSFNSWRQKWTGSKRSRQNPFFPTHSQLTEPHLEPMRTKKCIHGISIFLSLAFYTANFIYLLCVNV